MRAEAQALVDRIDAALALVRRSLDWERALRRLDELNARVEDPTLWDDPKQAQAIMREQKRLESAIGTVNTISSEMADAIEFIEMGEAEGDDDIVTEGLTSLERLAARADADKVQALLSGEADGNDTYLEIHAGALDQIALDLLATATQLVEHPGMVGKPLANALDALAGIARRLATRLGDRLKRQRLKRFK